MTSRHGNLARYRPLSPLGIVLGVVVAEFAILASSVPLGITPLSGTVAVLTGLVGLLPALLRPSRATTLVGCFAVLLAGILAVPFDPAGPELHYPIGTVLALPHGLIVRVLHIALLGPISFHLTTIFPYPQARRPQILAALYSVSIGLLLLWAGSALPNRRFVWVILISWSILLVAGGLCNLVRASRVQASGAQHGAQQARIMLVSIALAELPVLLRSLPFFGMEELISYSLFLLLQLLLPIGFAYAIIRHDLFGIDAVLRRALAYAALSSLVLVIYFGLTLVLTTLLAAMLPGYPGLATIGALLAAAALFESLRGRVQRLVDHALYPARQQFQHALEDISAALANVVTRAEIVALLTINLPKRLDATWADLWLEPAENEMTDHNRFHADHPSTFSGSVEHHAHARFQAHLTVAGRSLGQYTLGPRRYGPPYDRDELLQLRVVAQQSALALAYADTYDHLHTLNAELEERVTVRSALLLEQTRTLAALAERQRLARDLHDSVTQALFSISLGARALPNLVRCNQKAALVALAEQEATAQQALVEMRAVLAHLRTPLPSRSDLAEALRQHISVLEQRGTLHVLLDLPAVLELPTDVSEALLRVTQEALHNVMKHSGVTSAQLTLHTTFDAIELIVADQGCGFEPGQDSTHGFGLRGIRERIEAVDGAVCIESACGNGTVLRVRVPLPYKEQTQHDQARSDT